MIFESRLGLPRRGMTPQWRLQGASRACSRPSEAVRPRQLQPKADFMFTPVFSKLLVEIKHTREHFQNNSLDNSDQHLLWSSTWTEQDCYAISKLMILTRFGRCSDTVTRPVIEPSLADRASAVRNIRQTTLSYQ